MLHIGDGTPLSGNFNSIDWSLGNHSVKVEVDPNGGYAYVNMGTSQLTSAPYALYGEDEDADPDNELQTLSIVGNDLTISDGNTVTLPGGGGTSLWEQNGSDIYYVYGNVGIGTNTPEKEFHLFKGPGAGGGGYLSTINAIIEDDFNAYLEFNGSSWAGITFNAQNASIHAGYFYNYTNDRLMLRSGGEDNRMVVDADGNVGVGIENPLIKFQVNESASDGVLGSDLGIMYSPTQTLSPAVLGWSENNTAQISSGVLGHSYSTTSLYNEGVFAEGGGGSVNNYGVYGVGMAGTGTGYNVGIYGDDDGSGANNFAGYFSGDVQVAGTLSKSGGSFKIDHPQDPANKYLIHSFVESPDMMNIYNGNVITDASGYAIVELPSYFDALNIEFRYQLTVIGEFAQAIVKEEISGNQFTIQTDKPNVKVSWQVTGIRNDAWAQENRIKVEVTKEGIEKGRYIHPELFGKSADQGLTVGIPHEEHPQHIEAPIQEKTTDSSTIQE
ncbi:MAG: hypothetical protein C0591_05620 [Marinilabiliales bacterium]|nr:MAG: hypothetical protein C0591_05620 [Marinilabiliales bacterium]